MKAETTPAQKGSTFPFKQFFKLSDFYWKKNEALGILEIAWLKEMASRELFCELLFLTLQLLSQR